MKSKKSLQKLTEIDARIEGLLSRDQVTPKDLEAFSEHEKERFLEVITERFNQSKGTERDKFFNKIEPITTDETKNQLWEVNQNKITWAISTLMQEYGRMPTKTEIASKTDLSRQTIYKHLKEYAKHPQYLALIEQFRFMTAKVLAKVFQFAVNGDTAAAKLYLSTMGCQNHGQSSGDTLIQNQNNFIQINGRVLNQETIKLLKPEQLDTIENILRAVTVAVDEG